MKKKLTFGIGNAKLSKDIATFSLPCGWSCPFAKACKTKVGRNGRLLEKGHEIRCYAATQELLFKYTRQARWSNFDRLRRAKTVKGMADLIHGSLPNKPIIRVGAAGDFFSQSYFDAWIDVAKRNPEKIFYAYTKSIVYWLRRMDDVPSNFRLLASKGGKDDALIEKHGLRHAKVIFDLSETGDYKLSHDDRDAYEGKENLAFTVHGQQPANTPASRAWAKFQNTEHGGYKTNYSMDKYARFQKYKQENKQGARA